MTAHASEGMVPTFSHIGQRWAQTWLSSHSRIDGAFVLGYRTTGGGSNAWSERFNRFKFGPPRSQGVGIAVIRATMGSLTKQLLAGSNVPMREMTFARALGSGKTTANPGGPIAALTMAGARVFGNPFRLDLLTKQPHDSLHMSGDTADVRAEIIRNAGYRAGVISARVVIVFDDFITRGDTLGAIADAIKDTNPNATVNGVALAKNQGVDYLDPDTANDHLLSALSDLWDQHERG